MAVNVEPRNEEFYTFKDYMSWDEDVRCELIDGVVYNMAPPHHRHQRVQRRM
jgi:Uma2 family endonuclease